MRKTIIYFATTLLISSCSLTPPAPPNIIPVPIVQPKKSVSTVESVSSTASYVEQQTVGDTEPVYYETVGDTEPVYYETVGDTEPVYYETVGDTEPVYYETVGDTEPVYYETVGDTEQVH